MFLFPDWLRVAPARLVDAGRCVRLSRFVPHTSRGFCPREQPLLFYSVVAARLPPGFYHLPSRQTKKRTTCLVPSIANSPLSLYEYRQTFRRKHQDVKHCAIAQVKKYSLRVETSEVHSYPLVVTKPSSFHQKSIVIP